jgi:hypothetical protein
LLPRCLVTLIEPMLVRFRVHSTAKGGGERFDLFLTEWSLVARRYWGADFPDRMIHNEYMAQRFSLLMGQRLRPRNWRAAQRAWNCARRVGVGRLTLATFARMSAGWIGTRLHKSVGTK